MASKKLTQKSHVNLLHIMLVLGFPDNFSQAERLANRLRADIAEVGLHRFPDGESHVRLPPTLPEHVIICRSLDFPNDKLVELMLCARTATTLGAKRLTLVAPYLCYMRQDVANQPGEAVSQQIIGKLLADLFNDVITVDPHLHRISNLREAIPSKNALSVTAASEIAVYLRSVLNHAMLLGPDTESEQWVSAVAKQTGFDYAVARKIRQGDKQVEITLPEKDFRGKTVVIIDDLASTGRTISNALKLLHSAGAKETYAFVTHALFCGDAEAHLKSAGLKNIWSADSITHPTNAIQLDNLLAEAVESVV